MNRIIFKKLTIKDKKKILAGVNESGNPKELECLIDPSLFDGGIHCMEPLNPDSECAQGAA